MNTLGFEWRSTHQSDRGKVRHLNEDALLDRPDLGLWIVADGMGGHSAGDLASQMIVEAMETLQPQGENLGNLASEIDRRLQRVNLQLQQESQRRDSGIIGSTVVVLLAHEDYCLYLWAGDSRIYLYRRGSLRQLSRDHSQVEEQLEGVFADDHSIGAASIANYITRAVGAGDTLELEAELIEPCVGDCFLLCSDGLNKELADTEIAAVLERYPLQEAAARLLAQCLDRGGTDNVTLILVEVVATPDGRNTTTQAN
ncbi:MAG: protein phosphatase 2C domain-containing protein [Chromatiales bacterium]|jgi:protein phosphatase